MTRRGLPSLARLVRAPLTTGLLAAALVVSVSGSPPHGAQARTVAAPAGQHVYQQFTTDADFAGGSLEGLRLGGDAAAIGRPIARRSYARTTWGWSRWTSPWVVPGRSFTQVIPSWDAATPKGTFVEVQVRARTAGGATSGWKVMSRWAATRDPMFRRSSAGSQADALARAATDTFTAQNGVNFTGYQIAVMLHRKAGLRRSPALRSVGAVASTPTYSLPATSKPLLGARALAVPAFSQMIHRGHYPQYGGGGQAWCSPTSLSMLLGYYGRLPGRRANAWVKKGANRAVDTVARSTYDFGYRGTGNWSFNTAYAGTRGLDAFVTRLDDLRQAERYIAAGIPLIASISFSSGQLSGAPIGGTAGHLVVITGFTAQGHVIVNDPAAPSNASVGRVYDRGQFERAWMSRSAGTVYVVRDAAHPLP